MAPGRDTLVSFLFIYPLVASDGSFYILDNNRVVFRSDQYRLIRYFFSLYVLRRGALIYEAGGEAEVLHREIKQSVATHHEHLLNNIQCSFLNRRQVLTNACN